ncbi:hypothetical protein PsalMR5_00867 [Piscirickettsia salmonis]|uniref:DUF1561 family protein n=1 Tax=Piscirickettsia salmonis TaxID=1238 RepID=UPI0012BA6756|nr:DUF1561 family protein [Piscirickettsia salmonis]QGP53453.1 hypothetical protein PsalSR1_00866 [Piscirickettsia salmonis]QGP60629.1 hypothetical protein PsalBI1_03245 [Piscirickettsia salmonis]QGP63021.1 hypothetical protein PsalMR5_00867 [Piscirickettsia salmonis]
MVRDGIRPEEIVDASEYDMGFIEYSATGQTVANPYFVNTVLPPQQAENPAIASTQELEEEAFTSYNNASSSPDPHANNVHIEHSYAMSCAGVGASLPPMPKRSVHTVDEIRLPPAAPGCDYLPKAAHKTKFKDLPTIPSQLIDTTHGYCLTPTQASTNSLASARSYLYAQTCSSAESQKAIYDTLGRVVFSKAEFGIPMCMTAPENVINGKSKWDYVEFWPCDLYNPYQRWTVKNGILKPRLNIKLSIANPEES